MLAFESNSEPFTVTPLKGGSRAPTNWPEREGGNGVLAQAEGKSSVGPKASSDRRPRERGVSTDS